MTESSTICIGPELFTVLSDLRARECDVWSLDTAVAGNAGYRISFSEARRGMETHPEQASPDALAETKRATPDVIAASEQGARSTEGSIPSAPANSESLETRLQNLYEKAVKSGRVRTRFQTTTKPEHARLPHPND